MTLFWTALLMGMMGSLHCIGMCGPIAISLPTNGGRNGLHFYQGRILYNFGRILTYMGLGLLFGLFGLTLNLAGLQQSVSILSGALILLLQFFPGNLSGKISSFLGVPLLVHQLKNTFKSYFQKKGNSAMLTIGMLNGLLPCGFVYLALAGSIATGSFLGSALYMAIFGVGTFPVMFVLSISGKMIGFDFKNKLQKAVPYMITLIAILFILRGLSLGIPFISPIIGPSDHGHVPTEIRSCH